VKDRQNNELVSNTDSGAKQAGVCGKAKDIAVDQFPTGLKEEDSELLDLTKQKSRLIRDSNSK
jgi:hypothetical protein